MIRPDDSNGQHLRFSAFTCTKLVRRLSPFRVDLKIDTAMYRRLRSCQFAMRKKTRSWNRATNRIIRSTRTLDVIRRALPIEPFRLDGFKFGSFLESYWIASALEKLSSQFSKRKPSIDELLRWGTWARSQPAINVGLRGAAVTLRKEKGFDRAVSKFLFELIRRHPNPKRLAARLHRLRVESFTHEDRLYTVEFDIHPQLNLSGALLRLSLSDLAEIKARDEFIQLNLTKLMSLSDKPTTKPGAASSPQASSSTGSTGPRRE